MEFVLEVHMTEESLELLITLDDPGEDDLEEDTFNHCQAGNTVVCRPGESSPLTERPDQRTDVITDNDPY